MGGSTTRRTFAALGESLLESSQTIENLWFEVFGACLEEVSEEAWENVIGGGLIGVGIHRSSILRRILARARDHLNERGEGREGHVSLLIRDPMLDRLYLEASTHHALQPPLSKPPDVRLVKGGNYDRDRQRCFYQLCDRLERPENRSSEAARRSRGLTGWVAVANRSLRINSALAQSLLDRIHLDEPSTAKACRDYGSPTWGGNVTEWERTARRPIRNGRRSSAAAAPIEWDGWDGRFLAVPLRSPIFEEDAAIGVLRYSCRRQGRRLTEIDESFLESIGVLVSAVLNLKRTTVKAWRRATLSQHQTAFEGTQDLQGYLGFLARAFDSRIASVYVNLIVQDEAGQERQVLRLLDAYGIVGRTGDLRPSISDYGPWKEGAGLTWDVFTKDAAPQTYETVLDAKGWAGRNTPIFYGKAFQDSGLREAVSRLDDRDQRRDLMETYSVKLLGMKLEDREGPVGVVKVEFPLSQDSRDHYEKQDREFLRDCSVPLVHAVRRYKQFVEGEWFGHATAADSPEFVALLLSVLRLQLVRREEEAPLLWERAKRYSREHRSEVEMAGKAAWKELQKERVLGSKPGLPAVEWWNGLPEWTKAMAGHVLIELVKHTPQLLRSGAAVP